MSEREATDVEAIRRLNVVESSVKEHTKQLSRHEESIQRLWDWWRGNGSRGAEERIRNIENNYLKQERIREMIHEVSKETATEAIKEMHRTGSHRLRDVVMVVSATGTLVMATIMFFQLVL